MGETGENGEEVVKSDEAAELVYRGIKAMPFVIGNETFEKLGTLGTSSNLLVYLTTVFNMDSISATTLINIFNGTTNFSPLLGAFLCDTYLGRYKTLGVASVASFTGMLLLTLTAAIPSLHPLDCGAKDSSECVGPNAWQMAFLLSGFGLLVIGAGGIRPCNLAFGADQFDPKSESGRRGISSFFNWYYFTFTFAMMVSLTVIVYVQTNVSWALGLGIPTFLMFLSCAFFFVGTKIYVMVKPEGSPMASVAQVVAAAVRKRRLQLPADGIRPCPPLFDHTRSSSINCKLPYTNQFRFLDKGAMVTPEDEVKTDGSAGNPWRLSSKQQVEEVKCLIRVLPIWLAGLIYSVVPVQQQTLVIFQALQSDRRVGSGRFRIPAASYVAFTMLALTLWIPFYDRLVVPFLRRFTGKEGGISLLQKMGVGMLLSVATMLVSAAVERRRRHVALTEPTLGVEERRGAVSAMPALWLVPQLSLEGVSEAFTIVGLVEFYYKQFPENMRSIGAAFMFAGFAGGSYVSGFLVSTVNRVSGRQGGRNWLAEDLNEGRLDCFYFMVAGLALLNLGYFLVCSNWYTYKGMGEDEGTTAGVAMQRTNSHKLLV